MLFGYDKRERLSWGYVGNCGSGEFINCSEVEVDHYLLSGDAADSFITVTQATTQEANDSSTTVTQVTTQEANDSSLVAKTPEPSLILGLIALGGLMLGTRKKKTSLF
jgi:hypothetical protein